MERLFRSYGINNNNQGLLKMKTTVLFCLVYLLCPLASADARSIQQLSEINSRSQLLSASALLYFNPHDRTPDPRALTAVFHHLNTLDTYVLQLGQPALLMQPLLAMSDLFNELDGLPRDQRERYPQLVRQLLIEQQKLQQAADDQFARISTTPSLQPLNIQSQALAHLLLDYQLRRYPMPDKADFILPPTLRQTLDSAIEQRFDDLLAEYAEHAEILTQAKSSYQFVRVALQQEKGRTHGGAEFYLSRAVLDLDELAMMLVEEVPEE